MNQYNITKNKEELMFTISKKDYDFLTNETRKYNLLLQTIYRAIGLGWGNSELNINSKQIFNLLVLIENFDYKKRLLDEQEKENKENE